jgi:hypothetical protein
MRLRRSTASPSLMASLLAPPLVLVLVLVLGPDGVCAAEESLLRLRSRHAPGQAGMEEPLDQVAVLIATERGAVQLGDTDPMKNTPLHLAAARGYSRVVSALLAAGASVEASNAQMETALCVASRAELPGGGSPGLATVTALVEGGANVNHQPHGGYSPLQHCARTCVQYYCRRAALTPTLRPHRGRRRCTWRRGRAMRAWRACWWGTGLV